MPGSLQIPFRAFFAWSTIALVVLFVSSLAWPIRGPEIPLLAFGLITVAAMSAFFFGPAPYGSKGIALALAFIACLLALFSGRHAFMVLTLFAFLTGLIAVMRGRFDPPEHEIEYFGRIPSKR